MKSAARLCRLAAEVRMGGGSRNVSWVSMELNRPDSTQGSKTCPPDCGSTATPGQGALPPLPKYLPMPEKK